MSKLKVFTAYSHEDASFRQALDQHLSGLKRQGLVEVWFDGKILAGTDWDAEVKKNLASSDIIMPLISPAFIASDYCWDTELKHALERHNAGTGRILPVVIRRCDWKHLEISKLKLTPKDGKAVKSWLDHDEAWEDVVSELRSVINELANKKSAGTGVNPRPVVPSVSSIKEAVKVSEPIWWKTNKHSESFWYQVTDMKLPEDVRDYIEKLGKQAASVGAVPIFYEEDAELKVSTAPLLCLNIMLFTHSGESWNLYKVFPDQQSLRKYLVDDLRCSEQALHGILTLGHSVRRKVPIFKVFGNCDFIAKLGEPELPPTDSAEQSAMVQLLSEAHANKNQLLTSQSLSAKLHVIAGQSSFNDDDEQRTLFLAALDKLVEHGLVQRDGQHVYSLTYKGIQSAKQSMEVAQPVGVDLEIEATYDKFGLTPSIPQWSFQLEIYATNRTSSKIIDHVLELQIPYGLLPKNSPVFPHEISSKATKTHRLMQYPAPNHSIKIDLLPGKRERLLVIPCLIHTHNLEFKDATLQSSVVADLYSGKLPRQHLEVAVADIAPYSLMEMDPQKLPETSLTLFPRP